MDTISIADPGQELFDFGGLQMRRLATVPLSLRSLLGGLRRHPYTEQPVRRLAEEWALAVDGEAHLVQDELENSYQRREELIQV
jgi:hypothetical protein